MLEGLKLDDRLGLSLVGLLQGGMVWLLAGCITSAC